MAKSWLNSVADHFADMRDMVGTGSGIHAANHA
jgi:hypothetical protein